VLLVSVPANGDNSNPSRTTQLMAEAFFLVILSFLVKCGRRLATARLCLTAFSPLVGEPGPSDTASCFRKAGVKRSFKELARRDTPRVARVVAKNVPWNSSSGNLRESCNCLTRLGLASEEILQADRTFGQIEDRLEGDRYGADRLIFLAK